MNRLCLIIVPPLCLLLTACNSSQPIGGDGNSSFSFENGLEGWTADATDTFVGPDEIAWSVEPSTDRATVGNSSIKFSVDNLTDAAKVWIEERFFLEANSTYSVRIDFDFASQDFGDFNLWTILAGAGASDPDTASDATAMAAGDTRAWDEDMGFRWLPISRTVTVSTDETGEIFVLVGVWGTWETLRTYYVDNVRIEFTQLAP